MKPLHVFGMTAALFVGAVPAGAVDYAKLDRTIAREPAFRSKTPRYCLLAYGPEAKARVWIVLDGDVLYVDRNGNGDLTGDGKRFVGRATAFQIQGETLPGKALSFEIDEVPGLGKEPWPHAVHLTPHRKGAGDWVIRSVWDGYWADEVPYGHTKPERAYQLSQLLEGSVPFADRPRDAPVIHFGGPLTMTVMEWGGDPSKRKLVRGQETRLSVMVGTPVAGREETAFVRLHFIRQVSTPSAVVEFPNQAPKGKPILVKTSLEP
jgi:hypothetical protein